MRHVWIVMAVKGEYSDREEWVCGVYEDEETARCWVEAKFAADRERLARRERAYEEGWAKIGPRRDIWKEKAAFWTRDRTQRQGLGQLTAAEEAEIREINEYVPPALPCLGLPYPEADHYWVVCAPVGEWGKWDE